jgi:hypothetical protein
LMAQILYILHSQDAPVLSRVSCMTIFVWKAHLVLKKKFNLALRIKWYRIVLLFHHIGMYFVFFVFKWNSECICLWTLYTCYLLILMLYFLTSSVFDVAMFTTVAAACTHMCVFSYEQIHIYVVYVRLVHPPLFILFIYFTNTTILETDILNISFVHTVSNIEEFHLVFEPQLGVKKIKYHI